MYHEAPAPILFEKSQTTPAFASNNRPSNLVDLQAADLAACKQPHVRCSREIGSGTNRGKLRELFPFNGGRLQLVG